MIEISHLTKKFGEYTAVDDLNLKVETGEFFGLLGPNGAGKTTLIRIILGLLKAETGTIRLFGQELTAQSRSDLLLRIGVQNDGNLYENLTLEDNLTLWGQIYGLDQATIQKRLAELKQKFHLEAYSNMPVGSLSKGNSQKVMLARAMFHNPEVLILDEPTTGLDPAAIDEFYDAIKTLKQEGVTIIMSTHYLYGMDGVVDSIGIISEGRILVSDAVDKLRRQDKQVHFKGKFKPDHIKELLAHGQVSGNLQDEFTILVENEDQLADLVRSLVQKGNDIHYIYKVTETVKEIYFRIIGVDSHE